MDSDKHSFLYKQKISKKLQKLLYKDEDNNQISNMKIAYINKKNNNIKTHLDTDQNKNKQNSVIPKYDIEKSLIHIKKSFKTLKNSFNSNVEENSNVYMQIREIKEIKENIPFNVLYKGLLSSKSKKMNKNNNKYDNKYDNKFDNKYDNKKIVYHNNSCIKKNNMKSFQNFKSPIGDGIITSKQISLGPKNKCALSNLSGSKKNYRKNEMNKKKQSFGLSSHEINNNLLKIFNTSNKNNINLKNYYSLKNNSETNNLLFKTNSNLKVSITDCNENNLFDYNDERQVELTKEEKALYGDRVMKGYSKIRLLGKGGYGVVWLCHNNKDKYNIKEYAVKQTSKKKTQEFTHNINNTLTNARNEIAVLYLLNNKNTENTNELNDSIDIEKNDDVCELIPKIYDAYEDNNDIWFSFEKGGNSLSNLCFKIKGEFEKAERIYLIQKGIFLVSLFSNIYQFKYLLKQLVSGIHYINSKGIIHSDIKPENILIDYILKDEYFRINSIKIIDYGSSFYCNEISTSNTSNTPEYLCPEITIGNKKFIKDLSNSDKYISAVDVWSIGITFLELCLSCPIWMNFKTKITINRKIIYTHGIFGCRMRDANKIHQKQIEISKNLNKLLKNSMLYLFEKDDRINFVDLLGKMLNIDYTKRINTSEILKHPFLNEIL